MLATPAWGQVPRATSRFNISGFSVPGAPQISAEEFSQIVAPFIGRQKSAADVQRALQAVQQACLDLGYCTTQVTVPQPEPDDFVIKFCLSASVTPLSRDCVPVAVLDQKRGAPVAVTDHAAAALRFDIARYLVVGNTMLKPAEISKVLRDYTGRQRDFADVQRALEALQTAYSDKGYGAVQVTLPEQELERGEVRVEVMETRIGKIEVQGNEFHNEKNVRASLPSSREGATPNSLEIARNLKLEASGNIDVSLTAPVDNTIFLKNGSLQLVAGNNINYGPATEGNTFGSVGTPFNRDLKFTAAGSIDINNAIYQGNDTTVPGATVVTTLSIKANQDLSVNNGGVNITRKNPGHASGSGIGDVVFRGNHEVSNPGGMTVEGVNIKVLGGGPGSPNQSTVGELIKSAGIINFNATFTPSPPPVKTGDIIVTAGAAVPGASDSAAIVNGTTAVNIGSSGVRSNHLTRENRPLLQRP